MRTVKLMAQLDEIDPLAPVFVNICGHRLKIYGVEAQIGYAEIILYDEPDTGCNLPEARRG